MARDVRLQFKCWRCHAILRELIGEAHAVLDQVRCAGCGELNALSYSFPIAEVELVEVGGPTAEAPPAEPAPEKRKGPKPKDTDA